MDDTDSAPEMESAGEVASEVEATPEISEEINLDAVIDAAVEEHFEGEPTERPRDENGRFISTKEESPEEALPEEASDEGNADQEAEPTDTEQVSLEAPQHWPEADKERFAAMPKDAQDWALERDKAMTADYTRKTQEIAETRNRYSALDQTLEPLRAGLQHNGITESQYIQRLVDADRQLQQDPAKAIQWLAQSAGLDLASLTTELGMDDYVDPQIAALQNQVTQLSNHLSQNERQAAEVRQTELNSAIDAFKNAADEAGNLTYPHFDALRHTMGALIEAGQAQGMEDAYAKAIRLDDTLYQEAMEAERKKAADAEEKRRLDAVEKAKKIKPKMSSAPPKGSVSANDLDSLLDHSISQAGLS